MNLLFAECFFIVGQGGEGVRWEFGGRKLALDCIKTNKYIIRLGANSAHRLVRIGNELTASVARADQRYKKQGASKLIKGCIQLAQIGGASMRPCLRSRVLPEIN